MDIRDLFYSNYYLNEYRDLGMGRERNCFIFIYMQKTVM